MKNLILRTMLVLVALGLSLPPAAARAGELQIRVLDAASGRPLCTRMHVYNQRNQPQVPQDLPHCGEHFNFDGDAVLELPPGEYHFVIECGPEFRQCTGYFTMSADSSDSKTVEMVRFMDMPAQGWYSGDLSIARDPEFMPLYMLAEDLYVAPVTTWSAEENQYEDGLPAEPLVAVNDQRYYQLLAGVDGREGGCLRLFNLPEPLAFVSETGGPLTSFDLLEAVRSTQHGHADIGMAASWDTPAWVATGLVDSICLADEQLGREGPNDTEYDLRPADRRQYRPPYGAGQWAEHIYYELLNTGLRLPPSAGSGSGVTGNPVGYNRVYVYCGANFSYDNWWAGLRNGSVLVTNGPLLWARANGYYPGHVFRAAEGERVEIELAASMGTRDAITFLEIVRDGQVIEQVRLQQWAEANGQLPQLTFEESGWFLVRAVTLEPATYRYATTAPFYVEIGETPRISRQACQFFLDWEAERIEDLEKQRPPATATTLEFHEQSLDYWQQRLDEANAP